VRPVVVHGYALPRSGLQVNCATDVWRRFPLRRRAEKRVTPAEAIRRSALGRHDERARPPADVSTGLSGLV
jgi:hypothetical protein